MDKAASQLLRTMRERGSARFSTLQETVGNPRTLSKKLAELVVLGLVAKNDRLYSLTEKGNEVAELVTRLEDKLAPSPMIDVERVPHAAYRKVLRRFCELLLGRYGERLRGVLLFGSVARGDWDESSDLDLLVVLDSLDGGRRGVLREVLKLESELRGTREHVEAVAKGFFPSIEVYPLAADDAKHFRRLYLDALTEGIVLFERDNFLHRLIEAFKKRLMELGSRRIELPGAGHYWELADVKPREIIEL
jgi:predicted nucleotidyltransferase